MFYVHPLSKNVFLFFKCILLVRLNHLIGFLFFIIKNIFLFNGVLLVILNHLIGFLFVHYQKLVCFDVNYICSSLAMLLMTSDVLSMKIKTFLCDLFLFKDILLVILNHLIGFVFVHYQKLVCFVV